MAGAVLGGVQQLKIIPTSQVDDFPEVVDGKLTRTITLLSGSWTEIQFPLGTVSLSEEPSFGVHGKLWKGMITGVRAELTLAARRSLEALMMTPIIARVIDNNGLIKVLGSKTHPAYLTFKEATGTNASDRPQFSFTIMGEHRRPAPVHYLEVLTTETGNILTTEDGDPIYLD